LILKLRKEGNIILETLPGREIQNTQTPCSPAWLGINKGDTYNLSILNKKLGKEASQEGGDISSQYMDDGYLFFRVEPVETAVYQRHD
jgi:hypothetical protein